MERILRIVPACLLLAALLALGGCSQGESIPVEPVGLSLDALPDPFFRVIAPLTDGLDLYDCIQLDDGRAWIVGDGGLILARGANGVWYRDTSPTRNRLVAVYAAPDRRVWAVGAGGAVLCLDAGGWRLEPAGTGETLNAVWSDGDEVWAVGAAGTVLRGLDGVWDRLECPADTTLTGVWGDGEDRWVCGRGAVMLRYAGGTWTAESDGPWGAGDVLSVVRPEGGDLTVMVCPPSDLVYYDEPVGLYGRGPEGWRSLDVSEVPSAYRSRRLKAAGSDLWIETTTSGAYRLRQDTGAWIATHFFGSYSNTYRLSVGWAPGRDILLAGAGGALDWVGADGLVTPDPAGTPATSCCLFRMADGTSGFVDERGLFYWDGVSLRSRRLDYADGQTGGRYPRAADGLSIDDFFIATQEGLYHLVDGVGVARWEPENWVNEFDLAVAASGEAFLVQRYGLYLLPPGGGEMQKVEELGDARPEIRRLRSGRVVGWEWRYCYYFEDGAWSSEELQVSPDFVWEAADGVMGLFNDTLYYINTPSLHFWRRGEPGVNVQARLVPGDAALAIGDLRVGEQGLYACTGQPCRIFRLDGSDLLAGRWDAVTGLYLGDAGDFLPLDDGSLLVIDQRTDQILRYRDRYAD